MFLPYAIREGAANFRRAKFAAFASTSAIAVSLVLIGVFAIAGYKAQSITSRLREQAGEMEVFIERAADEEAKEALHARIETLPGVDRTAFISHEEAARIFRREFGEEASLFEDPTFLPASVKVWVEPAYANPDSMGQMAGTIRGWETADEVVFNRDLLARIARNRRVVTIAGGVLGGVVLLTAIFLVANTIRLTIYARRLLIRTMKLVGATDGFVRRPFLVEGVFQGLIGGVLAAGIVWGGYRLFLRQLGQAPDPLSMQLGLVGGLVLAGILLGWMGAYFAARRFIQNVELH